MGCSRWAVGVGSRLVGWGRSSLGGMAAVAGGQATHVSICA